MKDRISKNPGRVLVAPENGLDAFYAILSMADDPEQMGTNLNKQNLLSDSVAALFGFSSDATPNQVFEFIGQKFIDTDPTINSVKDKVVVETGQCTASSNSEEIVINTAMTRPVFVFSAAYDSSTNSHAFLIGNADQSAYGQRTYCIYGVVYSGPPIQNISARNIVFQENKIKFNSEHSQLLVPSTPYRYVVFGIK